MIGKVWSVFPQFLACLDFLMFSVRSFLEAFNLYKEDTGTKAITSRDDL